MCFNLYITARITQSGFFFQRFHVFSYYPQKVYLNDSIFLYLGDRYVCPFGFQITMLCSILPFIIPMMQRSLTETVLV